jgi:hypothetical protein
MFKMDNEKTYWLIALSPESESIAEQLIKPLASKGFRLSNILIFVTKENIDFIHSFLKQNKPDNLVYMLVDMTNNLDSQTFKAVLNDKYFSFSSLLAKYIKQFRKEKSSDLQLTEEVQDKILDKISKWGIESLTQQEKEILDKLSKR